MGRMYSIRSVAKRNTTQAVRRLARAYSQAPAAPGALGAGNVPKPGSPIAKANPSEADPKELYQAPNHASTWSTSQNPKKHAYSGPRFEQINLSLQPQPISAMEMVAQDPVRLVPGRRASCDGGGGPLGHPKIFINLDKPGPKACGYCGVRFEQAHH